jgi:hypothetical protein
MSDMKSYKVLVGGEGQAGLVLASDPEEAIRLWRQAGKGRANTKNVTAIASASDAHARLLAHAELLAALIEAASAHGRAFGPEHEVGDLQEILRTCWNKLSPSQQRSVYNHHQEIVEEWGED